MNIIFIKSNIVFLILFLFQKFLKYSEQKKKKKKKIQTANQNYKYN